MKLNQLVEEITPAQNLVNMTGVGKAINNDTVVADANDFSKLATSLLQHGFERKSMDGMVLFKKGNEELSVSMDDAQIKMTIVVHV